MTWLCIALGGALGSLGRHGLAVGLARFETFPFGTLAANVLGSLIIGIAAGFWEIDRRKSPAALFLVTGFCGGFTTFSTFSLQTLDLMQKNDWSKAGLNIAASVAICLICTWAGWMLGQSLRKTAS